jgi:hypothetical protein
VRGKGLARVTLKAYAAIWMARGAALFLPRTPHWISYAGTVVFLMCVINLIVVATWNLMGNIRDANETIKLAVEDVQGESAYALRPGGVDITTGPHLKYIAPALSGAGALSARPAYHFHPVAGYNDLGHYMDLGDEICSDYYCARERTDPR